MRAGSRRSAYIPGGFSRRSGVLKRPLLIGTGYVALGLGIAGVFLPLVPTTPFVLVAAWCFARSSPRLHAALLAHKRLGPPLRRWQEERAISRRSKIVALGSLAGSFTVLAVVFEPHVVAVAALPMTGAGIFIATRARPRVERDGSGAASHPPDLGAENG